MAYRRRKSLKQQEWLRLQWQKYVPTKDNLEIVAYVTDNPFITAGNIRAAIGTNVSDELIRQWLREAGIRNRTAAQKQTLSDNARARRLAFAQEHLQWTVND